MFVGANQSYQAIAQFTSADDSHLGNETGISQAFHYRTCAHVTRVLTIYFNSMGCIDWDLWISNSATDISKVNTDHHF